MPVQPGAMRSRWTAYAALSTTLAAGVVLKSLAQRPNFYSATVYLSQSSANLMILCNMVFVTACSFLILLQKFLYGPLRPIEIEQLYEKAWFAVTETCLAMTIFRGEIGAWFLVMFFSLLAGKVWGWIGEGRVEVLEQQQINILAGRSARLFHTRLAASLLLSVTFDMIMLDYVVGQVLHMARPDMMVMFGFEFAVLTVTSLSTATRYSLNLIEIGIVQGQKEKRIQAIRKERVDAAIREVQEQENNRSEMQTEPGSQPAEGDFERRRAQVATAAASLPIDDAEVEVEGWEGKGRWIFYLDLMTDFCKLVIYLSFFFILLIFYGLPLHIMRDVFLTCRSFIKRIGDFMRYRRATRDMNERYPDATEAEISDNECIICREEMRPYVPPGPGAAPDPIAERMRPKKLPCGHVLHFSCLRSWLERQQICPTCRATVVPASTAPVVAPQVQHPQNRANGRPRVFQLGPLRIGVGAGRGNNMLEELQEQLVDVNPILPPAPQNPNGPQQYGFGIRWDGMRRRVQGTHRSQRIQEHLDSLERHIQREVDSLQASMGELQALRNVQAQLARIRLARQAAAAPPLQPGQTRVPVPRPAAGPAVTGLVAQPQQGVLQAGSDQLPQGLVLPEGWTMMPLQPIQPQQIPVPMMPFQHVQAQQIPGAMPFPPPIPQPNVQTTPPVPTPTTEDREIQNTVSALEDSLTEIEQATQSQFQPQPHQIGSVPAVAQLRRELMESRERVADLRGAVQGLRTVLADSQSNSTDSSESATATPSQMRPQGSDSRTSTSLTQGRPPQQQSGQFNYSTPSPATGSSVHQIPRTAATQPRQPQVASQDTPSTSSRPTGSATISPPRQLSSTSQASSTASRDSRVRSPHRPTRSIGSSWGFSGIETQADADEESDKDDEDDDDDHDNDDKHGKDDDATDSDEDSDEQGHDTSKPNGLSHSRQHTTNGASSASRSTQAAARKPNPTIEDDSDPD